MGGFSRQPSAFTGRVVCDKAELTTGLSCPPSASSLGRRGNTMSMPPSLKKLGLKKPDKPIFGGEEENPDTSVAILGKPEVDESKAAVIDEECVVEEEMTETQKLMQQVKESGTAGFISYALWEWGFWLVSVPVCAFAFQRVTGNWPDFSNPEDQKKIGAEAFAFVNFARFAVPLRIGLALSTTPWIKENVVDRFLTKDEPNNCEEPEE